MYKKINKIEIVIDEDFLDMDEYGEFSATMGAYPVFHSRELLHYRWFNARNVNNMEDARSNYMRVIGCNRKKVCKISIHARAYINVDGTNQVINSDGVSDIISDTDQEEIENIKEEQINSLYGLLKTLGFDNFQQVSL